MSLVAGVDSSTRSCKVVIRAADSGELVRTGAAPHPDGTEVDPAAWWDALAAAVQQAGGLDDVDAVAVGGQQHGMVCLDDSGAVVRPALLWNDTRSAHAAADLVAELAGEKGGKEGGRAWADAVGVVPVAAITVTKLRWLAEHEPTNAARTAAVCLPHDWLTWRLAGGPDLSALVTDRGDASGTGYWSAATGAYRPDLPDATGALHGLTLASASAAHLARAAVEGLLCGLADALDALRGQGAKIDRVVLVGGGARSEAVRRIAPTVFGCPVTVPAPSEYVADGAARQAAWVRSGAAEPPAWSGADTQIVEADLQPAVRERYAEVRALIARRPAPSRTAPPPT